jgi:hypothetical protein
MCTKKGIAEAAPDGFPVALTRRSVILDSRNPEEIAGFSRVPGPENIEEVDVSR